MFIIHKDSEMTSVKFQLGPTLQALLKKQNINLRQLSETTGISQSTLYHWLENSTPRSVEDAKSVANYFKVSLHYLYFGEDDPYNKSRVEYEMGIEEVILGREILNIRITDKNDEIVLLEGYIRRNNVGKYT